MSFSIDGKTAIVTGAANGIGLAIARHFVEQGANVVFADMDEKRLKKEIEDIAEQENVTYFAGDLRERLTVANLLSATVDAFDQIDICIAIVIYAHYLFLSLGVRSQSYPIGHSIGRNRKVWTWS